MNNKKHLGILKRFGMNRIFLGIEIEMLEILK